MKKLYRLKPVLKGNRTIKSKKDYDRNRIRKETKRIKDGL